MKTQSFAVLLFTVSLLVIDLLFAWPAVVIGIGIQVVSLIIMGCLAPCAVEKQRNSPLPLILTVLWNSSYLTALQYTRAPAKHEWYPNKLRIQVQEISFSQWWHFLYIYALLCCVYVLCHVITFCPFSYPIFYPGTHLGMFEYYCEGYFFSLNLRF